jgi:hypothetical protein
MDLEDDLATARTEYDRREVRRKLEEAREDYREVRADYREHRSAPRNEEAPAGAPSDEGQEMGGRTRPDRQSEDRGES